MAYSSSSNSFSNSSFFSSDDEVLYDMDQEATMFFHVGFITYISRDLFIAIEMEKGGGHFVDPTIGVRVVLTKLQSTPTLFKNLINFIAIEFEDLASIVVLTIISHAWSTSETLIVFRRPSKFSLERCLLNFVFFLKHDNVTEYDPFMWNWAKNSMFDDVLFISSCTNYTFVDEICWPTTHEKTTLRSYLQELPRCIKFIDVTLIEILQPWWDPSHWTWFNGRKKFYLMNNTFILDHIGLFIYIDFCYRGSYHDVSIRQHFSIY
jgi:hypothetical protein